MSDRDIRSRITIMPTIAVWFTSSKSAKSLRKKAIMFQHACVVSVTCLLLIGCYQKPSYMPPDENENLDMKTPPADMSNLVALDPSCKSLYANVLLNCKRTDDMKSTECQASVTDYQKCSSLCAADVGCQTGGDLLKVSGTYDESSDGKRRLVIKSQPLIKVSGIVDTDVLYSAHFAGNAKTNYFSVYYTKRYDGTEENAFNFDIVVLTAQGSIDCPVTELTNIKSRTITLRNIPDRVPIDVLDTSVLVGEVVTTSWPKDLMRDPRNNANPPMCP